MGFMAGPERPPRLLLNMGMAVSASIAMAFTVFIAVKASAPAFTAVSASAAMSVTFGDNFTMSGLRIAALTFLTTSANIAGFWLISEPVSLTCGQETLSSTASAPASAALRAVAAYSSGV